MSPSTDPLDRLLHRSSPVTPHELDRAKAARAIAAMLTAARGESDREHLSSAGPSAEVVAISTRRRGPRALGKALVVTAVVLAAGTGVAAAGGFLPSGTGVFPRWIGRSCSSAVGKD